MSLPDKIEGHDGQLFKLVTRARHDFGTHARAYVGNVEQIERACTNCGLVRITLMDGSVLPRRYRYFSGAPFYDDVEPSCVSDVEVAIGKKSA